MRFRVGDLIQDGEGRRGVVAGWDPAHPSLFQPAATGEDAGDDLAAGLARGLQQPFYQVLFDGGVALDYTAQERLEAATSDGEVGGGGPPVRHELLERFMYRFVPDRGCYIPAEGLSLEFPEG